MKDLRFLSRVAATLVAVTVAVVVGWQLWVYYMEEPWTRDGRVRADTVGVAPDVSGLVSEVLVHDNQQVNKGDVLFRIDRARFELAVAQAEQQVANRQATWEQANRDVIRYEALHNEAVSEQRKEQARQLEAESRAALKQAQVEKSIADLNLERTEVKAPVPGLITNFSLLPGAYVTSGQGIAALVDSDSFYVVGYFEETKLPRIKVGDRASVRLMGEPKLVEGVVHSIAAGIEDRELTGAGLLANVNPTFSWVRLAQRVPVRIRITEKPDEVRLIAGRTASVRVREAE
jgi:RND family efflux transporter MFP subunit